MRISEGCKEKTPKSNQRCAPFTDVDEISIDRVTRAEFAVAILRELQPLTGRDSAVSDYVLGLPEAEEFLSEYVDLIQTVVRGYLREGKRFMTVAVGCTGGKHRSVAMTEEIAARMRERGLDARPMHRDLGRE